MANSRRSPREPGRIGSVLAAVGCLGVLALTFAGGFYTGRYWTRASLPPSVAKPTGATAGPPPARPDVSVARRAPVLTFYEELTVPLSPPPGPAAPGASRPGADKADSAGARRAVDRTDPGEPRRAAAKADPGEPRRVADRTDPGEPRADGPNARDAAAVRNDARGPEDVTARRSEPGTPSARFTVQIAAYSARASAEALRNTISASGHDAYIVETAGHPGAPRYRVRVGSYPSREAAVAAAARLPVPGERYVTTR